MQYGLFGNRGDYRMPETPTFDTPQAAREYFNFWWPGGNSYIVVLPLPEYEHTGLELGAL